MCEERLALVATICPSRVDPVADAWIALGARRVDARQVVFVPQRVPKLRRRVEPPLEREVFFGAGIAAEELLLGGPGLVRQVPRAADREDGIRHLARPHADRLSLGLRRALL